jgi:copper chaperone CopZ
MKSTALAPLLAFALAGACSPAADASAAVGADPAAAQVAVTFTLKDAPSCSSCTGKITHTLQALPGVSAVQVNVGETRLLVRHDPRLVSADTLLRELERAGMPASAAP